MWDRIKADFSNWEAKNPIENTFINNCIFNADSLYESVAFVLSNKISTHLLIVQDWIQLFNKAYNNSDYLRTSLEQDLQAILDRDFACTRISDPLLHYNGFHGLQLQRLANYFFKNGIYATSSLIHDRMISCCSMDIHPAVPVGLGTVIDHGIGVVIGETARIGNNVFMYHNVTLGSNGTIGGDRHPTIEDDVLLGSNTSILGNITIGKGSAVAAGSIVTKSVPPEVLVAGNPAKEIGPAKEFQKKGH
ncbi:MAG: hypothetical protein JJ971_10410 [Balneolaceae bacterium]|nr:hypothetical protein [Balneolaceae bacterium]MBO6546343.1 hypothetical protein [Balneolaceae bacterium]MBO6648702.1 hypothetical protein [Balneolaceae bacterium]